jgi:hypothetical protein
MSRSSDRMARLTPAFLAIGALGAACIPAAILLGESDRLWYALLANFAFFTPILAGLAVWPAIVEVSNGGWSERIDRHALAAMGFAPASLLVLALLWAGAGRWAVWLHMENLPQKAWLNGSFLFPRDIVSLAVFWALVYWFAARKRVGVRSGGLAGTAVLSYGIVFSLLAFDLIMPLAQGWNSTLFGWYFFMTGLYGAVAAWILLSIYLEPALPRERLHDLGKLLLGFCMLSTYMMFAQLLPYWYENLPEDVIFLIPRMREYPWDRVTVVLLAVVYLGPIAMLLTRRGKRSRGYLGAVAAIILCGLWLERLWLVYPSVGIHRIAGIAEIAAAMTMFAAAGLSMTAAAHRLSADTGK